MSEIKLPSPRSQPHAAWSGVLASSRRLRATVGFDGFRMRSGPHPRRHVGLAVRAYLVDQSRAMPEFVSDYPLAADLFEQFDPTPINDEFASRRDVDDADIAFVLGLLCPSPRPGDF